MIGILFLSCLALSVSAEVMKIGDIVTKGHGVKGTVSVHNSSTIIVDKFEYDGGAPDAFFMVGATDKPMAGGTILPYPFEGKFFEYSDKSAPIIEGVHNGSRMVLTLPSDHEISDFKWFAVWCRAFEINFGDVYFPKSLKVSGEEEESDSSDPDIPSPIAPIGNDISEHKDHEYHHGDSSDAESEAESHAEHEPRPGSAALSVPSLLVLSVAGSLSILLNKL